MIRISLEEPDGYKYRLDPLIKLRQRFAQDGILVGFDLKSPDLRIIHHDTALKELEGRSDGRFTTPIIVDERIDSAQVNNSVPIRLLMTHPDVKFWLRRNTFRDYKLNNVPLVADRYHYELMNELPEFHIADPWRPSISMEITEEMAKKIRLLPTFGCDRFAFFFEQEINWDEKRQIDVSFAGLVDYEVRGSDYWDGKLAEAYAVSQTAGYLPNNHRQAAIRHLTRLRHLRVLIGMNRVLGPDLYQASVMRTSISVSPWGFGEYAYRDYESILAGCVLIKPPTDHVETFGDMYQSGKYYIACKSDFSDLPELVEDLMSDRSRTIDFARRAREDMIKANSPSNVYSYYFNLFRDALGDDAFKKRSESSARTVISLAKGAAGYGVRAEVTPMRAEGLPVDAGTAIVIAEDRSSSDSHDVRFVAKGPVVAGLYRLRVAMRGVGRTRAAVQLHVAFKEEIWINVDLEQAAVQRGKQSGTLFAPVYGPELTKLEDGWVVAAIVVEVTDLIEDELGLVLYPADVGNKVYYDGDGRIALEAAMVELTRIDLCA